MVQGYQNSPWRHGRKKAPSIKNPDVELFFQPYGPVELNIANSVIADLALDALLELCNVTVHRVVGGVEEAFGCDERKFGRTLGGTIRNSDLKADLSLNGDGQKQAPIKERLRLHDRFSDRRFWSAHHFYRCRPWSFPESIASPGIWRTEAGGQLFARFELPDIIVEEATGPRLCDLRTRFFVSPQQSGRTEGN